VGTAYETKAVPRVGSKPGDRLQQTDTGDLLKIIERLLPTVIAPSNRMHQRQEGLYGGRTSGGCPLLLRARNERSIELTPVGPRVGTAMDTSNGRAAAKRRR
jgi:hypothetical protein